MNQHKNYPRATAIGFVAAVVLVVGVITVLVSCGKCQQKTEVAGQASAPLLQDLRCPPGQLLQAPVTTKTLLNGDIVSYDAACVKVTEACR